MYVHPDFDHETRIAAVRVGDILFASIYVPNGGKDFARQGALPRGDGRVRRALRATGDRVVLCGDLNVARTPIGRPPEGAQRPRRRPAPRGARAVRAPAGRGRPGRRRARGGSRQRRAVHLVGAVANMRQRNIGWRLDYVLASGGLAARVRLRVDARVRHQRPRARGGDVRGGRGGMIIVSDFDGTLTLDDVTTYLWDKYLPYDWRAKLLPPTFDERWTPLGDDRARLRGRERAAQGAAGRDPQQHPAASRRRGAGDVLSRGAAGTSPSSATGSRSTSRRCCRRGYRSSSFVGTYDDWKWRVSLPATVRAPRPRKTSRAASSPTCAPATRGTRPCTSATADSTWRRRLTCVVSSPSRDSPPGRLARVAGRDVEEFELLDESPPPVVFAKGCNAYRAMPNPTATFSTTMGDFKVELFLDQMPITAGNFVKLAKSGFYDGLHFHRVIDKFMVQFGCPHSRSEQPARRHRRQPLRCDHGRAPAQRQALERAGTLSMANTGPDSGSCQFFINVVDNPYLDWFSPGPSKHPVFGKVVAGMDVVRDLEGAARTRRPAEDADQDEQDHRQRRLIASF